MLHAVVKQDKQTQSDTNAIENPTSATAVGEAHEYV